jgi:hypothetical protein
MLTGPARSRKVSKNSNFWRRLVVVLVVLVRFEVHSRNQDERLVEEEEDKQLRSRRSSSAAVRRCAPPSEDPDYLFWVVPTRN